VNVPYLPQLAYPAVEALRAQDPIVLLPIGAIEAHGPHLPLETDTLLSLELARRVGAALAVEGRAAVIAAPITFSVAGYASGFAGTISLGPDTATALVREVGAALLRMGFSKLCFVNNHLDPAHVDTLRVARASLEAGGAKVAFPDQLEPRWGRTLSEEYKRGACHAGSYETSLLLASTAGRAFVDDAARVSLPRLDINLAQAMKAGQHSFEQAGAARAYFGDPAAATVEEGEWLYARLVEMVVTTVHETWG
jgi:creatinine amidohydrolase